MTRQFRELREGLLHAGVAPHHVARYMTELADHFADLKAEEERAGRSQDDAKTAAMVRLGSIDDLVKAMTEQRHFQSWCARGPWAIFGLAPVIVLAGAWLVGAMVWLSGFNTPLTSADKFAFAMYRVRMGSLLYFFAPVLIGWGIGFIAARQRFRAIWPTVGLVAITLLSSTLRLRFTGFASELGGGMRFGGMSIAALPEALFSALTLLLLTALPYFIWRLHNCRSD